MRIIARIGAVAAGALSLMASLISSAALADRPAPPPLYGYYNLHIDFSKQTFDGKPTPMKAVTFPVPFTTGCDADGCVARMDNSDDLARNPGAPASFDYRWNKDRWETSGQQPYLCSRTDRNSAVPAQRSDYWMPNGDGSFSGVRTLVVGGAGCPGEGPGTHVVPIFLTPIDPPTAPAAK